MSKLKIIANIEYYNETKEIIKDIIKEHNILDKEELNKIIKNNLFINIEDIIWIRYYSEEYEGWLFFKDDENIDIDQNENNYLKLLIKIKSTSPIAKKKITIEKNIKNINKFFSKESLESLKKESKNIQEINGETNSNSASDLPSLDLIKEKSYSQRLFSSKYFSFDSSSSITQENDICILTSNPLVEMINDKDYNPLTSMNDFNQITYSIYSKIKELKKDVSVGFLTLTKKNLEIAKSSKIIHIICKSCYIKKSIINNNPEYCCCLLFENEKCQLEKICEEDLKKILEKKNNDNDNISSNIENYYSNKIIIISTQFAVDAFNMLKNIGFQNIIVQHTTIANEKLISEFNQHFYNNLIELGKTIDKAYNFAKDDVKKKYEIGYTTQNCCCFHSHSKDCKNMEKFINQYDQCHFNHLRFKCESECMKFNRRNKLKFNEHYICCNDNFVKNIDGKTNLSGKCNLCCCKVPKKYEHNFSSTFFVLFSNEMKKNEIFENYKTKEEKQYYITPNNLIKNEDKNKKEDLVIGRNEKLVVGRNEIMYKIFKKISESNNTGFIIDIFNWKINDENDNNFFDSLEGFISERIPNLIFDYGNNLENLKLNHLNSGSLSQNNNSIINKDLSLGFHSKDSAPDLKFDNQLYMNDNSIEITNNKIYILKDVEKIRYIFNLKNISKQKIIIFSLDKCNKEILEQQLKYPYNNNGKREILHAMNSLELSNLSQEQFQFFLQKYKISCSKQEYEKSIEEFCENNELDKDSNILRKNTIEDSEIIEELIFLLHNNISGLIKMEIDALYQNKSPKIIEVIKNNLHIFKEELCKEKNKPFYKYKLIQEKYKEYKKEISENIIQEMTQKLLEFYFTIFRFILTEEAQKSISKKEIYLKKYRPVDSLTSFSAHQKFGLWYFEKKINLNLKDIIKIYEMSGYFNHLRRNFDSFLKLLIEDNYINFFIKNDKISEDIEKYIEDISITYPTCLKMFKTDDSIIINFIGLLGKYKNNKLFYICLKRIELFNYMFSEYDLHNKENITQLTKIYEDFEKINCFKGQCEVKFAEFIVNFRENEEDFRLFESKIKEIKSLIGSLKSKYSDDNKEFFNVFETKINYVLIRKKIKLEKAVNIKKTLNDLTKSLKIFNKYNFDYYVEKIMILICRLLIQSYFNAKKDDEKKNLKKEYIDNINMAKYISLKYNKKENKKTENKCNCDLADYFDDKRRKIEKKYNIDHCMYSNNEKSEIIQNGIVELCKKYNISISENEEIKYNKYYYDFKNKV